LRGEERVALLDGKIAIVTGQVKRNVPDHNVKED
jgi:hypothetical protein